MHSLNLKHSQGFTLLEAIITIAIISILSSIALPSFQSYIASHQSAKISSDLFAELRSLRQLSISRASNVVVCASSDESSCLADVSDPNKWNIGWIAFLDLNQNNQRDSATEDLIIFHAALTDGSLIYSGGGILTFDYQGSVASSEQFSICPNLNEAEHNRAIIVNTVGRAQRVRPSQLNTVISCS